MILLHQLGGYEGPSAHDGTCKVHMKLLKLDLPQAIQKHQTITPTNLTYVYTSLQFM